MFYSDNQVRWPEQGTSFLLIHDDICFTFHESIHGHHEQHRGHQHLRMPVSVCIHIRLVPLWKSKNPSTKASRNRSKKPYPMTLSMTDRLTLCVLLNDICTMSFSDSLTVVRKPFLNSYFTVDFTSPEDVLLFNLHFVVSSNSHFALASVLSTYNMPFQADISTLLERSLLNISNDGSREVCYTASGFFVGWTMSKLGPVKQSTLKIVCGNQEKIYDRSELRSNRHTYKSEPAWNSCLGKF